MIKRLVALLILPWVVGLITIATSTILGATSLHLEYAYLSSSCTIVVLGALGEMPLKRSVIYSVLVAVLFPIFDYVLRLL